MSAQTTSSLWHVGMRNGHNACTIYAYDGKEAHDDTAIAHVFGIAQNRPLDYCKNDPGMKHAVVIAAALEMQAALRAILFQLTQGDKVFDRDACITQARAAYMKSIGRAP